MYVCMVHACFAYMMHVGMYVPIYVQIYASIIVFLFLCLSDSLSNACMSVFCTFVMYMYLRMYV